MAHEMDHFRSATVLLIVQSHMCRKPHSVETPKKAERTRRNRKKAARKRTFSSFISIHCRLEHGCDFRARRMRSAASITATHSVWKMKNDEWNRTATATAGGAAAAVADVLRHRRERLVHAAAAAAASPLVATAIVRVVRLRASEMCVCE